MSLIEGAAGAGAGMAHNARNMNSGQQTGLTNFHKPDENAVRTGAVQKTDAESSSGDPPHQETASLGSKEALEARNAVIQNRGSQAPNPGQDTAGSPMSGTVRTANRELAGATQALGGMDGSQMQAASMPEGFAPATNAGIGSGFSGMGGGMSPSPSQGGYLNKMI
ncbi:MAG: hypothetical protein ACLFSY_08340 [Desulfonatronovibrionaceae bacterium]